MLAEYGYKQTYEQVFHQCSSGLIFIDKDGVILDVNDTLEQMLKVDKETLYSLNIQQLFAISKEHHHFRDFLMELRLNGQAEIVTEITASDGETKYVHFKASKQLNSELYLIEMIDETEKMSIKKRLDHSDALSTIGQLAASIAHEIRNPITSLKGFTQLLLKNADEDGKRYLDVIEYEIDRMEEILTELLQVSKPIEEKYVQFAISPLILEVVHFMSPQAVMKGIEIHFSSQLSSEILITGNRKLLKQVFINTLKNAMEAISTKGNIYIFLTENDTEISIEVMDEGIGILPENLDKIFNPFFTTKSTGTGLGLPYMNRVIESHKGRITVKSKYGQGTSFLFFLPKVIE